MKRDFFNAQRGKEVGTGSRFDNRHLKLYHILPAKRERESGQVAENRPLFRAH